MHLNDWDGHYDAVTEIPRIVSADDHVVEPPDVFTSRLPAKYRDVGPRVVRKPVAEMTFRGGKYAYEMGEDDGPLADWWIYEDRAIPAHAPVSVRAGFAPEEVQVVPMTYDEMRPGCYQQEPRLDDMDLNWVEASLCFPTFPRFCGQTFLEADDKELALLCVQAYNDWMVEEWCAGCGGRLFPLCLIPLWDPSSRPPRCGATRRAAYARCASRRCRRTSGCRRCTTPTATGTRSSPRATRPAP